jgi:hypothetical protein
MLLQRNSPFPSSTTRILYTQLRPSLLDPSIVRVVVLAHNLGALPVSKAVSQLFSDLPADKLSKLEIYTFGAAASEFVLPTGEAPSSAPQSPTPMTNGGAHHVHALERRAHPQPHIEHFALTSDPFSLVGVLRSVRSTLETRFCGGVFVMSPPPTTTPKTSSSSTAATGLSITTYLTALFPTQMSPSPSSPTNSVLNMIMLIDRDVAEKREFAAMSNFASLRSPTGGAPRDGKRERLSWTGLGAIASQKKNSRPVMDGVAGLEMARKGCKDCDGHKGSEVSWLVRYVNVGWARDGDGERAEGVVGEGDG